MTRIADRRGVQSPLTSGRRRNMAKGASCQRAQQSRKSCARSPHSKTRRDLRFSVTFAARHDRPDHPRHLVGERNRSDLRGATSKQLDQPGPPCSMPLRIADDCERTDHEQLPQVSITLLGDASEPFLAAAGVLPRHQADPGSQVPAGFERPRIRNRRDDRARKHRLQPGEAGPLAFRAARASGFSACVPTLW